MRPENRSGNRCCKLIRPIGLAAYNLKLNGEAYDGATLLPRTPRQRRQPRKHRPGRVQQTMMPALSSTSEANPSRSAFSRTRRETTKQWHATMPFFLLWRSSSRHSPLLLRRPQARSRRRPSKSFELMTSCLCCDGHGGYFVGSTRQYRGPEIPVPENEVTGLLDALAAPPPSMLTLVASLAEFTKTIFAPIECLTARVDELAIHHR